MHLRKKLNFLCYDDVAENERYLFNNCQYNKWRLLKMISHKVVQAPIELNKSLQVYNTLQSSLRWSTQTTLQWTVDYSPLMTQLKIQYFDRDYIHKWLQNVGMSTQILS